MKKAYVWGIGEFYRLNSEWIHSIYDVVGFVDGNKKGMIENKKIISSNDFIISNDYTIVICASHGIIAIEIAKEILSIGGVAQQVVFAANDSPRMAFGYMLRLLDNGNILCEYRNRQCEIRNKSEYVGFLEVFVNEAYSFSLSNERDVVVLDVGMNIGDSVVFFSYQQRVKYIYA